MAQSSMRSWGMLLGIECASVCLTTRNISEC